MSVTNLRSNSARQQMELIEVTPDLAAKWLESNTGNRRISNTVVQRYASDMKAGRWRHPTGEALIFDRLGRLQQGQHRLLAILAAETPIMFWVMWNAEPEDFAVLDQGLKRSVANVIGMTGEGDSNNLATVARVSLLIRDYRHRSWGGLGPAASRQEVLDFYKEHTDVVRWATQHARAARAAARVPLAQYGALAVNVFLMSQSLHQWDFFHQQVINGDMLPTGSPALALRNWCIRQNSVPNGGEGQQMRAAICIKAWNAHVTSRDIKVLSWKSSELMPDVLPSTY